MVCIQSVFICKHAEQCDESCTNLKLLEPYPIIRIQIIFLYHHLKSLHTNCPVQINLSIRIGPPQLKRHDLTPIHHGTDG